jgi:hypothetical protein
MNRNIISVWKIDPETEEQEYVEDVTCDQLIDILEDGFMVVKAV